MKTSKYNIIVSYKGRHFLFNQLSTALREVDSEMSQAFLDKSIDESQLDEETLADFKTYQFLCDDKLQEENLILYANKMHRFANKLARVTIMPTLDCNFRCWYCYESHHPGSMSQEAIETVMKFCETLISVSGINTFMLDWFGGEPLMYFDEIVYPISSRLKTLCGKTEVRFINVITTNGAYISSDMIRKMSEIDLRSFQITLDGYKNFHDKTRFYSDRRGSYDDIVNAITEICRNISGVQMSVRINYTPANLPTIDKIAQSFPEDVRDKIIIEPQLVWQFKDNINALNTIIKEKLEVFSKSGYKSKGTYVPTMNVGCYAENLRQYVINYDLNVFKCTARDFSKNSHSIGTINKDGVFVPSSYYYEYFKSSYFENEKCLACELLPSCAGMCIQKRIENSIPKCSKDLLRESLINQLQLFIDAVSEEPSSKEDLPSK